MTKPLLIFVCSLLVFITCNSQELHLNWVNQYGSGSTEYAQDIITDDFGNVYFTGVFQNTIEFEVGGNILTKTSYGGYDIYIAKANTNGQVEWVHCFGGSDHEIGVAVNIDNEGSLYTTGIFNGTVNFDPQGSNISLSSNGAADVFLMKHDPMGNFLWVKSFGGNSVDKSVDLIIGPEGGIYITGLFTQTVDFDPDTSNTYNLTSVGSTDWYVAKFNDAGSLLWVKSSGGIVGDDPSAFCFDSFGNIILTGQYQGTSDFDPGANTYSLTSNGETDIMVIKLDPNGSFIWAKSFGGNYLDYGYGITCDNAGNIYVTGGFRISADFDPGQNINTVYSNGLMDAFILKLNADGNPIWTKTFGQYHSDYGSSIQIVNNQEVFVSGFFYGDSLDFDPGLGEQYNSSQGSTDIFITRFDTTGNFINAYTIGGPGSENPYSLELDQNENIYLAGYVSDSVDIDPSLNVHMVNSQGLFDGFIAKFSFCEDTSISISEFTCNAYNFNGNILTSSGNYVDTLISTLGCDSIIFLNLSITNVDTSITQSGNTLTANAPGLIYQWIDCGNNYLPITGANNQSYIADNVSSYAVIIDDNGCIDTSFCYDINNIGINENKLSTNINIYPNPIEDFLFIEFEMPSQFTEIQIMNLLGEVLIQHKPTNNQNIETACHPLNIKHLSKGTYILRIIVNNNNVYIQKLIKG